MDYINQVIRLLILLLVLILIVYGRRIFRFLRGNKFKVNKKTLVKSNQFANDNKDKLEHIYQDSYQDLKPYKYRFILSIILLIACAVSVFFINNQIYAYVSIGLSFIIAIICVYQYDKKNKGKYNEIVKNVLKEYDSNLEYRPNSGFSLSEYYLCLFPEKCDRFHSEDMIINTKTGFHYSDIKVESEHSDHDGDTHYVTEFKGSLARIDIKNMNCLIFLGSTSGRYIYGKNNFTSINFENDEFNSLFRACTNNELLAYKLLTPDIMEEFVNIKKNTYGDIDIRIIHDKLYIRFLSGDTFDNTIINKSAERNNLLKSIAVLEEVMKTMEKVKKIIDEKNMD